jgi:hypothetical protein
MQLIQSSHVMRPARGPLLVGTAVGAILLFGGLALAWLAFATPVIRGLTPSVVRPAPDQVAIGALVWGVALVAPPCFAIVGALRLGRVAATVFHKPGLGPVVRVLAPLPDDFVVAASVLLPEGRNIRNVVLGPFGLAVLSQPPPSRLTRRHGSAWEVRRADGRWVPFENPLERASRDAERVRRWIAAEETDFVVKIHAAVVTTDPAISRTPTCAVITPEQIPAWLASLPPQRSLNPSRREDVAELLRAIA